MKALTSRSFLINERGASLCPECGNISKLTKSSEREFLYISRTCKNGFNRKELVCKKDDISNNYFWNSPASKFIDKNQYLKGIKVFDLLLTKACNSECKACFVKWCGDNYEEMSLENLKKLLKLVKDTKIVLNGGEPTVRKDLTKIIKIIVDSGNKPMLYTNGLKLSDLNYLKHLKKAGLKEISMSFDGFDKKVYESIRGGKQQYSMTLQALKNLEREKIKVLLYSTIIRGINEDQVEHIIDYAVSHDFIWTTSFKPLYLPGTDPCANFNKNHVVSYSEILNLINSKIEEINYQYIRLTQKIFCSLQEMFANRNPPIYLSWVDLPSIYMVRKGDKIQPLFSYDTLEKIQNILETAPAKHSITSLSKILSFNLNGLENLIRKKRVFRILLGGVMPQNSSYTPPIAMVCQKKGKLSIYSYLAW